MLSTPLGRVRLIGLLEGTSFLLLLGIAMPLKYGAGMPQAVQVVGWAHGVLFVLYLLAIGSAMRRYRWPITRGLVLVLASLVPFGPFLIDGRLKREASGLRHAGVQ